jgi:hypothetical protein
MVGHATASIGLILSSWQGLQGEDLVPLLWPGGNAIGHRGSLQLSEHIVFALCQSQPGILGITLQQTLLFQAASNTVAEGCGRAYPAHRESAL